MKSLLIFACVTFAGCSAFLCPNQLFPTLPCRKVEDCTSDCGSQSGLGGILYSGQQQYGQQQFGQQQFGQQAPTYQGLPSFGGYQQSYPIYAQQNAGYYSAIPQSIPEPATGFAFGNMQAAQGYTAAQTYPPIQSYSTFQNFPSFQTGGVYPAYPPVVGDLHNNAALQMYPGLVSQPSKAAATNVNGASNKK